MNNKTGGQLIKYHNVPSTSNTTPFKVALLPSLLASGRSGANLHGRRDELTAADMTRVGSMNLNSRSK